MELIDAITTRASAARLTAPGPTAEHLAVLIDAANHAPDHGRLRPWRVIVLEGERRACFVAAVVEARRRRAPPPTAQQLLAEREKFMRAPALLVVGCVVRRDQPKVPEIEQVLAAGAAAQNLILAAHALGYGAMWKTGPAAYDAAVKASIDLGAQDHIVAIVHLGSRVP
ncbi:MAG TPA: nitroreductase [Steroidobacteraceae bacterium]|nr:nitroreductase [Steroidobacteraceae bacterium]